MEILGGPLFGVAGAGESHGPAITTIVFGCPPGLYLRTPQIQHYLDRRRPGGNRHGTPRNEKDKVVLLSGLYSEDHDALTAGPEITVRSGDAESVTTGYQEGYTTGEPIAALVLSTAKKSADYAQFCRRDRRGAARPHRSGQTSQIARLCRCARRRAIQLSLDHLGRDRRLHCALLSARTVRHGDSFVDRPGRPAEGAHKPGRPL